jgi:hypothetical protein
MFLCAFSYLFMKLIVRQIHLCNKVFTNLSFILSTLYYLLLIR